MSTGPCPCGLLYEAVDKQGGFVKFLCTAPKKDKPSEMCNELQANHPHEQISTSSTQGNDYYYLNIYKI